MTQPTRAAVEDLKAEWESDPCWDLEDTDGFEAYRDELAEYALVKEAEWASNLVEASLNAAARYGVPGNHKAGVALLGLEHRVKELEEWREDLREELAALRREAWFGGSR